MASVDDRIVRMEFDNAAFEKKLATTLTSLGQLDKALKFTGATKGLTDVSEAAGKMNFGVISDGIENVSKKFIALSTIAITALSGITSRIIQAGAQFVKSFTFGPIFDGFREFETNANSIQTILANTASKGTTLTQVTDALNLLNTYSDKTIYNFGQMARNIGTFTAAGVDLDTSVNSIKGIANLAAMSGSSADQASTAMYQLSQAIAAGSLHLMDWNSVVNAGMGGEAFKNALFETGKAMGNVLNVPVDQTFKQWEDSGHSFRESLQDGWITADILTTTLSTFTGDMTEEMLLAKGFNEQQATQILKTAAIAQAAATEVKTFTQLIGTVKEAIGTGFADSFRIVIGNFTEAKDLFTNINNVIGGFVSRTSDARNAILQGWKDFGGRNDLIQGVKDAFGALGFVITAVKDAFSDIFPPVTAATLIRLTFAFKEFALSLTPSADTLSKIHDIARGVFAALSIGWEVIKEGTKFIAGLAKSLLGLFAPETTGFLAKLGDGLTSLQAALVKGGGIKTFFEGLTKVLQKPIELLGKVKEAIGNIFSFFNKSAADAVGASMDRVGNRFESLKGIFAAAGRLWGPFETALMKIVDVLDQVWQAVSKWFNDFIDKISEAVGPGAFNNVLDLINVGLLGGIVLILRKFFKEGFKFDLTGGLVEKVNGVFEQLTGTLKAMQLQIKAQALMKIAEAIAILTASVVVLSLIDSVALTKALSAMAVGFGELMASFAVLSKIASGPTGAASFTIMSTGLIMLSSAILILSLAVKVLSTMSWEELIKGLGAVVILLGSLVVASKLLESNIGGMISAGIGIAAMAAGLFLLAIAMKILATMSWEEMAQGLIGVAGGLAIIVGAFHIMPSDSDLIKMGASLTLVGVGLLVLAAAISIFGTMNWETMGKGFLGIAVGLGIVAGAMHLMPGDMPALAGSLLIVSAALVVMAVALTMIGAMSWESLAKGLVGIGVAMAILVVASKAMEDAIPGAGAMVVVAGAMLILAVALKIIGSMSWEDIAKGLVAIAASLIIFAAAAVGLSEVIPAMLGLGVALLLLGAGFALIGVGAFLIGKGLESIAKSGAAAAEQLPKILKALAKALPAILQGMAEGLIEMAKVFTDAAPIFAKAIGKLIEALLVEFEKIIPKLGTVIRLAIEEVFSIIRSYAAEYIKTGLFIITTLLTGIRDNIGLIVTLVGDIIVNFLNAMTAELPRITQAGVDLLVAFITAIGDSYLLVIQAAVNVVLTFIAGLATMIDDIITAGANLIIKVIEGIGSNMLRIIAAGSDTVIKFLEGLSKNVVEFANAAFTVITNTLNALANVINERRGELEDAGKNLMAAILNGMTMGLAGKLKDIGDKLGSGLKKAVDIAKGPLTIIGDPYSLYTMRIGHAMINGITMALDDDKTLEASTLGLVSRSSDTLTNGFEAMNENASSGMTKVLSNLAGEMSNMDDFNPTITPVLDLTQVASDASKIGGLIQPNTITPVSSMNHARAIARGHHIQKEPHNVEEDNIPDKGINFTQINNSPTQLSTSDIYKQTRNQIRIAKEELSIP